MELFKRRNPLLLAAVLGLSLGAVGCNQQGVTDETVGESTAAAEPQGEVVATVNGTPITEDELKKYSTARGDSAQLQDRQAILDELVTQTLVYQDALKQNLDKDPEIASQLEKLRTRVLVSAAVRQAVEDKPATEEQLRAQYDELKDRMVTPEYKASHILVAEEEQATALIEQLNEGADFAELAREHSTDSSAEAGGDLGWVNPQQVVPPFALALAELEDGSYTKAPVQSQFGWHIVKMDEQRQSEPPPFEQVEMQLAQMVQQRQIGEYIQGLKDGADISIQAETDAPAAEETEAAPEEAADVAEAAEAE